MVGQRSEMFPLVGKTFLDRKTCGSAAPFFFQFTMLAIETLLKIGHIAKHTVFKIHPGEEIPDPLFHFSFILRCPGPGGKSSDPQPRYVSLVTLIENRMGPLPFNDSRLHAVGSYHLRKIAKHTKRSLVRVDKGRKIFSLTDTGRGLAYAVD